MYFDNAASSIVSKSVRENMEEIISEFANPTSSHRLGIDIRNKIDTIRKKIIDISGDNSSNVIFTSGASESNYQVIKSVTEKYWNKKKHIITSDYEHDSVKNHFKFLEENGFEITYLKPVDSRIRKEDILSAIKPNTILISIIHVNNEIGIINDIDLSEIKDKGIIYHTDIAQSFGKLHIDMKKKGVDLITFSGHKFGALKGIGGIVGNTKLIKPIFHGGSQEYGLRPGTQNTSGILSVGLSLDDINESDFEKVKKLKDKFIYELTKIGAIFIDNKDTSPYILPVAFKGIPSEVLSNYCSNNGLFLSYGSACNSEKSKLSNSFKYAFGTENAPYVIRLSFSPQNTLEEADKAIEIIISGVEYIRSLI